MNAVLTSFGRFLTSFGRFLRSALRAPVEMTLLGLTSFRGFLRFGAYVPSVEMTLLGLTSFGGFLRFAYIRMLRSK